MIFVLQTAAEQPFCPMKKRAGQAERAMTPQLTSGSKFPQLPPRPILRSTRTTGRETPRMGRVRRACGIVISRGCGIFRMGRHSEYLIQPQTRITARSTGWWRRQGRWTERGALMGRIRMWILVTRIFSILVRHHLLYPPGSKHQAVQRKIIEPSSQEVIIQDCGFNPGRPDTLTLVHQIVSM